MPQNETSRVAQDADPPHCRREQKIDRRAPWHRYAGPTGRRASRLRAASPATEESTKRAPNCNVCHGVRRASSDLRRLRRFWPRKIALAHAGRQAGAQRTSLGPTNETRQQGEPIATPSA